LELWAIDRPYRTKKKLHFETAPSSESSVDRLQSKELTDQSSFGGWNC